MEGQLAHVDVWKYTVVEISMGSRRISMLILTHIIVIDRQQRKFHVLGILSN